MRRHYANVAATVALFLALGGTAVAAHHYLITRIDQISPQVREQLRGGALKTRGPTGKEGPLGFQGEPGLRGPSGPTGQHGEGLEVITERGERGETGPRGPEGFRGFSGVEGRQGATGPTGPTGGSATVAAATRTLARPLVTSTEVIQISSVEPYEPQHDGQGRYGSVTIKGKGVGGTLEVVAYEVECRGFPWPCLRNPDGYKAEHFKVEWSEEEKTDVLHAQLVPLDGKTVQVVVTVEGGFKSLPGEAVYSFPSVVRTVGWSG